MGIGNGADAGATMLPRGVLVVATPAKLWSSRLLAEMHAEAQSVGKQILLGRGLRRKRIQVSKFTK
jgi:hypothetical protein